MFNIHSSCIRYHGHRFWSRKNKYKQQYSPAYKVIAIYSCNCVYIRFWSMSLGMKCTSVLRRIAAFLQNICEVSVSNMLCLTTTTHPWTPQVCALLACSGTVLQMYSAVETSKIDIILLIHKILVKNLMICSLPYARPQHTNHKGQKHTRSNTHMHKWAVLAGVLRTWLRNKLWTVFWGWNHPTNV